MSQHASLTPERWARFSLEQRVLMIGNELHRTSRLMAPEDAPSRRRAYERVLALTDLTVALAELLRWRDLVAVLYLDPEPQPAEHAAAFRCLLRFTPGSARQVPLLAATAS